MPRVDGSAARAQGHGALNLVLQLSHVAGPPILRERVEGSRAQLNVGLPQAVAGFAKKERAEVRDFLAPVPQWRHMDSDDRQSIVKILAKLTIGHTLFQIG